tara:strand:- start:11916 stop:12164 length:249 start_codon:yes stop_codon:yes gene_type:complete
MKIIKIYYMKKIALSLFLVLLSINHAYAYIGLAALLPIFGQAIIFVVIFLLALIGLLFYPVKILISKILKKSEKKAKSIVKG